MHEPFNPHCSHCRRFVYCFSPAGPLADWGYCRDEVPSGPPLDEQLQSLEAAAGQGNYVAVFAAPFPIFQETDDGCGRFVPR